MDVLQKDSVKLKVNGKDLLIGEILMKHFKAVHEDLAIIGQEFIDSGKTGLDLKSIIAGSFGAVEKVIQTMTGTDTAFTDELGNSQIETILKTILEVNKDSFLLQKLMETLKQGQKKSQPTQT